MRRSLCIMIAALCTVLGTSALAGTNREGLEVGEVAYLYARTLLEKKDRTEEDTAQAERWLRTAIRLGEGRAALQLAEAIEEGDIKTDPLQKQKTINDLRALGIALRKVLAEAGDNKVASELGLAYLYGRGIPPSQPQAFYWIERAAKGGDPRALLELARMVRWGAAKGYTPEQSITLLEEAAKERYATAVRELGETYASGAIVPADETKALSYYEQAASYGNAESMRRAGLAYIAGRGAKKDTAKGVALLERAAAAGSGVAMYNLAMLYRFPPAGQNADSAASLRWLEKAAGAQQADAQFLLGNAYANGQGVPKDNAKARYWLNKAVEQGYFPAEVMQKKDAIP